MDVDFCDSDNWEGAPLLEVDQINYFLQHFDQTHYDLPENTHDKDPSKSYHLRRSYLKSVTTNWQVYSKILVCSCSDATVGFSVTLLEREFQTGVLGTISIT
jgi:hypothetical protein